VGVPVNGWLCDATNHGVKLLGAREPERMSETKQSEVAETTGSEAASFRVSGGEERAATTAASGKRPYVAPTLKALGNVAQLTFGSTGTNSDVGHTNKG